MQIHYDISPTVISTVGTNSHHSQAENMWKINTVINPKQGCVHVDVLSDYWRLLKKQTKKNLYVDIILMSFQTYLPMDYAQKSYFEENLNSFVYTIDSTRPAGFKITLHVT